MDKLVNRIGNSYPALVQSHMVITADIQGHVRTADIPERPLPIERPLSLARRAASQLGSPQHPSVNPRKFSVTIGLKRGKRLALNAMRAFGFTSAANPVLLPQPEPRAVREHFIVLSISSRDVACAEWPNIRRFEHFLKLLDIVNDAFNVHAVSISDRSTLMVKQADMKSRDCESAQHRS